MFRSLCATQKNRRLLNGDLHHRNVLRDSSRGWVAIDPKGVIGEVEFEASIMLSNPNGRPDLFASPEIIARRVEIFSRIVRCNQRRVLEWAFAQSVLSALWTLEDTNAIDTDVLNLSALISTMLE
jgi:streptomycin 6-kinase